MLTLRLSDNEEKKLADYCKRNNLSKTSVVKEALAVYFAGKIKSETPYQLGSDLFGQEGSEDKDKSTTYKKRLKEKLSAKHTH